MQELRPHIERMLGMPARIEGGHFRKQHRLVSHIAHGWLLRCTRGCAAIVAMDDAGFGGECHPLARSVIEHLVALRWLAAEGELVKAPLKTTHHEETKRLKRALEAAGSSAIPEETLLEVLASSEHDDHGRDHLQQFAHRAVTHGTPQDLIAYQSQVMLTHATFQSSIVYLDVETQMRLFESRVESDWLRFSATSMYRALYTYSQTLLAPPWKRELREIRLLLIESGESEEVLG